MSPFALSPAVSQLYAAVTSVISPVYLVGGCVRDLLLGIEPHDFDFPTPLKPDEIEAAVHHAGKRAHTVGKRFGTIGFKVHGRLVEVTTFRTEIYSVGSRKPSVEFVNDITFDLSRRDFTMNAMAIRADGSIVDPFGGMSDIHDKVITTVNKPCERFNEDPLRMLRAARFSSQLDFRINEELERQATKKAGKIIEVSKERWTRELDSLLISDHPDNGLGFLARSRLINYMIPELAVQIGVDHDSPYNELNLWQHTVKTVSLAPKDVEIRWAALFHDIGKPYARTKNGRGYSNYVDHEIIGSELVEKIGPYLKWPTERTTTISHLVRHHLDADSPLLQAGSAATRR